MGHLCQMEEESLYGVYTPAVAHNTAKILADNFEADADLANMLFGESTNRNITEPSEPKIINDASPHVHASLIVSPSSSKNGCGVVLAVVRASGTLLEFYRLLTHPKGQNNGAEDTVTETTDSESVETESSLQLVFRYVIRL